MATRCNTRTGGLLVLVALVLGAITAGAAGAASKPECNGHVELCRRRYDEVAYAATHNSMNTSADRFSSPEQERSIADQLAGGIRAFLVDVYSGTPGTGMVCTDPTPLKVAQVKRDDSQAAVDQLLQIRASEPCPAPGGPTAAQYLCHDFCELGASKLDEQFANVATFLRDNPNDVVTLILEDYAPAADIMKSFRAAGLDKQMVRHNPGEGWPTLAQMKKRGTRLVVFSQHQGGAAPGLLDAFKEMNETPFTFHDAAEFSCAPSRGPAKARLFLLNHWIDDANTRGGAHDANQYAVLDARAQQCATERGHMPNFVAVNFAEEGDLLRVVDNLNGVQ